MVMNEDSGAPVRRGIPAGIVLYGLLLVVSTGFWQLSDDVRPPYVGWRVELTAGAITAAALVIIAYWGWYR